MEELLEELRRVLAGQERIIETLSVRLDGLLEAVRLVVLQFENVKKWPTQGIEEAVKALEEELEHW